LFQGKMVGVVVPAYNEERLVATVIDNMPTYVDRVYVVDDGSTDRTRQIVSEMCQKNGKLELIEHKTNRGVGAAIATGYRRCLEDGRDIAVVMAGDDQMDPAELPNLLAPVINGEAGYCKGNRMSSLKSMKGMPLLRRFGNWLLKWATRVSSGNYKVMDPQNGYAAASADALQRINLDDLYPYYGYCNHLLAKLTVAGVRTVEVSIPARYQGEKSKIRYGKYIRKVSWLLLTNFAWRMESKLAYFSQWKRAGDRASRVYGRNSAVSTRATFSPKTSLGGMSDPRLLRLLCKATGCPLWVQAEVGGMAR
jgi:glycosyltransferase involved in cell wall biosynthesis